MERNHGAMEKKLWYYTEKYKTLIYYGKNYDTMEKTMVLKQTIVSYSIYLWTGNEGDR